MPSSSITTYHNMKDLCTWQGTEKLECFFPAFKQLNFRQSQSESTAAAVVSAQAMCLGTQKPDSSGCRMGMTSLYMGQVGSREDLALHHSKLEQFCGNKILLINEND